LFEGHFIVFLPRTIDDPQRKEFYAIARRNKESAELRRVLVFKNNALAIIEILRGLSVLESKYDAPVHFVGRLVVPTELEIQAKSLPARKRYRPPMRERLQEEKGLSQEPTWQSTQGPDKSHLY